MKTVKVAGRTSYTVYMGKDALSGLGRIMGESAERSDRKALVITDKNVAPLYLKPVLRELKGAGFQAHRHVLPPGEKTKSWSMVHALLRVMTERSMSRDSVVMALGGGVVGDLAGFAASVYMRGCRLVQVPTTLLAQVDSSVGGKVGVNLREGKNLAGAFYPPVAVVCDTRTLESLPARELRAGTAEIVKYGCIYREDLFDMLEDWLGETPGDPGGAEVKSWLLNDTDRLQKAIELSVETKAEIVKADEHENGLRMILNFGHTFGHALEQVTGYRKYLHGEAVFLGMRMATRLSLHAGLLSGKESERVLRVLQKFRVHLPRSIPRKVYAQMQRDKKMRGGKLHYVLLEKIGAAVIKTDLGEKAVLDSITEVIEDTW